MVPGDVEMSRGIGSLQRAICDTLAARPGADEIESGCRRAWLADGVHDLRTVSHEMAKVMGGIFHNQYHTAAWQASFSRAVAGLVSRKMIESLSLVPLRDFESDYPARIEYLSDCEYLNWPGRQCRFVRAMDISVMKTSITLSGGTA